MIYSNIEDLRQQAQKNLPRIFFDYLDSGAFSETTMRRNITDFSRWTLDQRIMVDLSERTLEAKFLNNTYSMPAMLAPVGFTGMFWPDGEVCAAKAATKAGIPMCLSTFSINSMEEVSAAMPQNLALQLYVFKDRGLAENMLNRAWALGIKTLFLTADTDVSSVRERDTRNGFRTASNISLRTMIDMATHPMWCLRMAKKGLPQLGNVKNLPNLPSNLMAQTTLLSKNVDPSMKWEDIDWLRQHWPGKIVIKGVLNVDDAKMSLESGVDAIVVSNHGGRQLDHTPSTISVLPEIAQFIDGRMEVLFDGGIRRGSDIVKAVALGADAVLLGRAVAYGVAAAGEEGVSTALSLLRAEMDITLALMGLTNITELRAQRDQALKAFA